MATVRFFAAAAEAVGSESLVLPISTVGELRETIRVQFGVSVSQIIGQCSILVNGQRTSNNEVLVTENDTVDVLPPFAGG